MLGSLRRLMMRSPTATRWPRAAATVGEPACGCRMPRRDVCSARRHAEIHQEMRLLYVAVTRAIHQVVFAPRTPATEPPGFSPLLLERTRFWRACLQVRGAIYL